MKVGNLEFVPIEKKSNLIPVTIKEAVNKYFSEEERKSIYVAEIDPNNADGTSLCERYNINHEISIKCLAIEGKRNTEIIHATILLPIDDKYSSNVARKHINAKQISFAPLEEVIEKTKMEFGSITPIGIPNEWHLLIDSHVMENEYIVIGGGLKHSKILIPPRLLLNLPNAIVLDNLAKHNDI